MRGTCFPPLFSLDSEAFAELKSTVELREPILPHELQELAGYDDEYILHLAEVYFQSTYGILPIGKAHASGLLSRSSVLKCDI